MNNIFLIWKCYNWNRKEEMIQRSKNSVGKKNVDSHKNLIKHFKIHFNPLLLPKLALIGYHLKKDSSYQVFLSKLQLFDRSAIERQNLFIEHMKKLILALEEQGQQIEEKMYLVGVDSCTQKSIKSCINFEEKKYQYDKILSSRLMDLKEFIFHVERLDKEPIQQKQCKNILQNEIHKIHRIKTEMNPHKQHSPSPPQQRQNSKYFKMNQYKARQVDQSNKNIQAMLRNKTGERKYNKSKTHFNERDSFEQVGTLLQPETLIKDLQQAKQPTPDLQKQSSNKPTALRKTTIKSQQSHRHKEMRPNTKKKTYIKTEANDQEQFESSNKGRKVKNVRSVNYLSRGDDGEQKDKMTSIAYINSTRTIVKSSKRVSRNQQSQFFKNKNFLKSKKKSIKMQNEKGEFDDHQDSSDKQEPVRKNVKMKTVKFSQKLIEQKKNFIKPNKGMRKFGRRQTKLLHLSQYKDTQQFQAQNQQKQNDPNAIRQSGNSRNTRRQGFQQEMDQVNLRRSVANLKRKGKILGLQANKNLERLLLEDNIQDMLLENELYGRTGDQFNPKNKGKYLSKKLPTQGHSRGINRSKGNNILMEIDFQEGQFLDNNLYVPSQGFKVNSKDLKSIRQKYVHIMPYQQKRIAEFYGGQNFESINHQFNTNEQGQYYFNRLVVHNARSASVEQYIPYNFSQDAKGNECLRFDFGRHLSKQCNKMEQKDLQSSVLVTNFL